MQIHYLSENNSILNHFLSELRDVKIQSDSMRFRRNIERVGEVMSYEISKNLSFRPVAITTPLGVKNTFELSDKIVVCSILRAGLALHQGFLNYFDFAENGFVSAYRHHPKDRKSTRLNSSHVRISYAVFCLKKKKIKNIIQPARHYRNLIHRYIK